MAETPPSSRIPPDETRPASGGSAVQEFRRQHDELQAMAFEIAQQLVSFDLKGKAPAIRVSLEQFATKLRAHADAENAEVYPRLLRHRDPVVRAQAQGLLNEVDGLYDMFHEYSSKWCNGTAIEDAPVDFVRATMETFRLLARRMIRENKELYPMVERAG